MSLQTAGKQSPVLLAAILLFGGWVVLSVFRIFNTIPSIWTGGDFVGQSSFSGFVGLAVLFVFLGLLIALYGALEETSPTPERFPPER